MDLDALKTEAARLTHEQQRIAAALDNISHLLRFYGETAPTPHVGQPSTSSQMATMAPAKVSDAPLTHTQRRSGIKERVRDIVKIFSDKEFTTKDIESEYKRLYPEEASLDRRTSFSTAASSLVKEGILICLVQGKGRNPSTFKLSSNPIKTDEEI